MARHRKTQFNDFGQTSKFDKLWQIDPNWNLSIFIAILIALDGICKKNAYRGGRNKGVPTTRANSQTHYLLHTAIWLVGPSEGVYTPLVPDGHVAIWPYGHLEGFTWHPAGVRWIYGQTRPIKPYSYLTPKSTIWLQTLLLLYQS